MKEYPAQKITGCAYCPKFAWNDDIGFHECAKIRHNWLTMGMVGDDGKILDSSSIKENCPLKDWVDMDIPRMMANLQELADVLIRHVDLLDDCPPGVGSGQECELTADCEKCWRVWIVNRTIPARDTTALPGMEEKPDAEGGTKDET